MVDNNSESAANAAPILRPIYPPKFSRLYTDNSELGYLIRREINLRNALLN